MHMRRGGRRDRDGRIGGEREREREIRQGGSREGQASRSACESDVTRGAQRFVQISASGVRGCSAASYRRIEGGDRSGRAGPTSAGRHRHPRQAGMRRGGICSDSIGSPSPVASIPPVILRVSSCNNTSGPGRGRTKHSTLPLPAPDRSIRFVCFMLLSLCPSLVVMLHKAKTV